MSMKRSAAIAGIFVALAVVLALIAQGVATQLPDEPTPWWVSMSSFILSGVFSVLFQMFLEDLIDKYKKSRSAPAAVGPSRARPISSASARAPDCCCILIVQVFLYVGYVLTSSGVVLSVTTFNRAASVRTFGQGFAFGNLVFVGILILQACFSELWSDADRPNGAISESGPGETE
jgi:hypothetical protein